MDDVSPLEIRERERERLARLLNAWLDPDLNLLLAQAGAYEEAGVSSSETNIRQALHTLSDMAARALEDLHDLADDLAPAELHDLGLVPALESLALRIESRYGLSVTLDSGAIPEPLPPHLLPAIYRITQQALHNAGQHANAGRVGINVRCGPKDVRLTIADDGDGFDPPEPPGAFVSEGKYGIDEMAGWAAACGGDLALSSVVGVGTQVQVMLPLALPEPGSDTHPGREDAGAVLGAEELTPRENDVLVAVAEGLTNKQIAMRLGISDRTVQFHLSNVLSKLGAASRTEAAVMALQKGLDVSRQKSP